MSHSFENREFGFRIGHEQITWSVRLLILANVAVFAGQLLIGMVFGQGILAAWLAFEPRHFLSGMVWTPLTYLFLHAGLFHLFVNMLMLYFFGPDVERVLGTRQFIWFYLICGILGVMANYIPILLTGTGGALVLGASGATLGVLVAFAMVEPDRQIFLFPLPLPVNARALVIILVVMNLISALNPESRTSVSTHFGGMIVAYFYMKARPWMLQWELQRRFNRKGPSKGDLDKLGEEIDNIFKFQDKDRR